MNITETNKEKILDLLTLASEHVDKVNSLIIQIGGNIEPFIPYMLNDRWPVAVDPLLIADPNSEEDKISRAHGILSIIINEPIYGSFLDFGCGEGHVVNEVVKRGNKAVGYDPTPQGWNHFQPNEKLMFTSSWGEVQQNAPYNYVLIYDVLDHLKDEKEIVQELSKVKGVLSDKGKVYVRCHPWTSRHGTHLYHSMNHAYLHMLLDEKTIDRLGYKQIHTIKLIHPIYAYERCIKDADLKIASVNVINERVEPFFIQPGIASLIKRHWSASPDADLSSGNKFPDWQLSLQFVDYVLEKNK